MRQVVFIVEPSANNGWTARGVNESIVTSAPTIDELRSNIREAVNWRYVRESTPVMIKLKISNDKIFPA
jgi:hypothetical protein